MDLETLGAGGASGFVAAVLTLLGWERRLKKVEETKVNEKSCDERHGINEREIQLLRDSLDYIKSRVDRLIDIQMNGARK